MPTIALPGGGSASYRVEGNGPLPVLSIAGGPGSPGAYMAIFARPVADVSRWYLVDPPGTGETPSAARDEDSSLDGLASFHAAVGRALGLERPVIAGHSHGGAVATRFAATRPDDGRALLLLAGPIVGRGVDTEFEGAVDDAMEAALARHAHQPWYPEARRALFADAWSDDTLRAGLPTFFAEPTPELVEAAATLMLGSAWNPQVGAWFYAHEWPGLDLRADLARIGWPVLAVVGEHDWLVPPPQARLVAANARDGAVAELPGIGHMAPMEDPDAYRAAVVPWLKRLGAG